MTQYYEKPTPYTAVQGYASPPQKQRGCLFYGCLIAIILTVVSLVAVGVAAYVGYRYYANLVNQNTEPTPVALPKVELPEEELKSLTDRWESFRTALKEDQPTEEIELSAQDINALIEQNEDLRGRVHIDIEDNKIKAQLSIPVDFLGPPGKGRFFNAEGELKASLEDENLVVKLVSAKIKGKPIDNRFMTSIKNENLAKNAGNNKENADQIAKLESIKVQDGKVIIVPRKRPGMETKKAPEAKAEESVEVKTEPAEPKKEVDEPKVEAEKAKAEVPKVEDQPKAA